MPVSAGDAYIPIHPDASGFQRELQKQVEPAVASISQKLGKTGMALTKTLTPAALAMGAVFRESFQEWDAGVDAIRAGTGATGDALKDLQKSFKNVAGQVTQPLSQVGQVMADLQTRTGLTGPPLERLTKQMLDLNRIGQDVTAETMTRTFGDWGIAAEDSAESMDSLFRASQATGPSMEQLGSLLTQYGAPLRQLGFGFEESAAMLGKFEKEGVNTQLVLGSMRVALGKMARAGEEPIETFRRVTGEIKNAGSAGEANAMALELFGARAGPDMAAAIREGRFELGGLVDQVKNGSETIAAASADTLDWSDKFAMLRNRVVATIGPVGEIGMAFAGVAAGIGPAMLGLSKLGPVFAKGTIAARILSAALTAMPWVAVAAAVVAIGVVIYKNWDSIVAFLRKTWDWIKSTAQTVWNAITDFFRRWGTTIVAVISGPVGILVLLISRNWDTIRATTVRVWTAIRDFFVAIWTAIRTKIAVTVDAVRVKIVAVWTSVRDLTVATWNWIRDAVRNAVDQLRQLVIDRLNAVVSFYQALPGRVVEALSTFGQLLWEVATAAWARWHDAVQTGVAAALKFIRELPSKISKELGDFKRLLFNKGKELIQGFIDGIKSMAGQVAEAVTGVVSSGLNTISFGLVGSGQGDGPGDVGAAAGSAYKMAQAAIAVHGGRITSGYRTPAQNARVGGSPTSYHLDQANPAQDIVSPNMAATFSFLAETYGRSLRELIYGDQMIRRGRLMPYSRGDHWDHVHVAHRGGVVSSSWPTVPGLSADERPAILQVGETVTPAGGGVTFTGPVNLFDGVDIDMLRRRLGFAVGGALG